MSAASPPDRLLHRPTHAFMSPMPNDLDLRAALDDLAQALSVISPLATTLRRTLTAHTDEAVALEAAVDRAMHAMRRLQPAHRA
jgi:hypothetical protein